MAKALAGPFVDRFSADVDIVVNRIERVTAHFFPVLQTGLLKTVWSDYRATRPPVGCGS
jgi:hypothetical protein